MRTLSLVALRGMTLARKAVISLVSRLPWLPHVKLSRRRLGELREAGWWLVRFAHSRNPSLVLCILWVALVVADGMEQVCKGT